MMRSWATLLLVLLLSPAFALAQNTGKLTGTVIDASTGEPLPGASVVLEGTTLGAATDIDGQYTLLGVPVGTYDVRAQFVGYTPVTVNDVEINSGYTRTLDFDLQPGTELEGIVVQYERPIIQNDAIGAPRVVTAEDIENLPVRGASSLAALQGGVVSRDGSSTLNVRGGRGEEVDYYVDGVKVIGAVGVPQQAIQEQEMLIGTIPAKYGDAMSGVISITTKSGQSEQFFGSIEGITSEVLDPYGYNLGNFSFGGPVIPGRLSFFISGGITAADDATPYDHVRALSGGLLDQIQRFPQSIQVTDEAGDISYRSLPTDLPEGIAFADMTPDQVTALLQQFDDAECEAGLSACFEGFSVVDNNIVMSTTILTDEDFEEVDEKDDPSRDYNAIGNITLQATDNISLRFGGGFTYSDDQTWSYTNSLYNPTSYYNDEDQTARGYVTWRQRLGNATFYQLQAEYSDVRGWYYGNGFSRDVEDALFYGDLAHPANEILTRYYQVNQNGELARYTDGNLTQASYAYGLFSNPGNGGDNYQKYHRTQLRFSGNATTQVGLHQLEFGGEFEQQTNRSFYLSNADALARYYADIDGAESTNEGGVTDYRNLEIDALRAAGATYYGYNYLGTEEVDTEDQAAYLAQETREADLAFDPEAYNIAPHEPIYYAGYVQDKIEYNDIVLQLGARIDVFDNNTPVLRDIYATVPVVRFGDLEGGPAEYGYGLEGEFPLGVESDDVVYFNNRGDIVGYRETNENAFIDATGNESSFQLINNQGQPRRLTDADGNALPALSAENFEDYKPRVTFMPRIGVSFPVTDRALFFASYNVTSQRPSEQAFVEFAAFRQISGQSLVPNARLDPEKTTQYELGLRQRLGQRAALQLSGFYRTQENKIRRVSLVEAYPSAYTTYTNADFSTTKGVEFEFDLRRTNGLALNANYTLQFAEATGSDSGTLAVIAWLAAGSEPNFVSPAAFDQRHSINLSADYRLGEDEGPEVLGAKVLENVGLNLLVVAGSGFPYTELSDPEEITNPQPSTIRGSVNAVTTPWTGRVDFKIDRRFELGGFSARAYLWVQNLFNQTSALKVYRATGLPDNDGFFDTREGQNAIDSALPSQESYEDQYRAYMSGPVNVTSYMMNSGGGRIYTLPRRTRLGLLINF